MACCSGPAPRWIEWTGCEKRSYSLVGSRQASIPRPALWANAVIYNYGPEPTTASVLLHVGVQKVVIGLLVGERLEYARSSRLSRIGPDQVIIPFSDRITRAMDGLWETIQQRAKPLDLKQIYLSGGPAQVEKIGEVVHARSSLPIIEVNPFREIDYSPATEAGTLAQEGGSTFTVAVGLALRGFKNL